MKKIGFFKGHTSNYMVVNVIGKKLENKIINVKVEKQKDLELYGKKIETQL